MGDKTGIEWTDATWTPIRARNKATGKVGWHCEHKSEACRNCYAEALNLRLGTKLPFKPGHLKNGDVELFMDSTMLSQPLRWQRPRTVFVCSMTDLFADFVTDEWIDQVFAVMALSPQHTFQVLTKRPARMRGYIRDCGRFLGRQDKLRSAIAAIGGGRDAPGVTEAFLRVGGGPGLWRPLPNVWFGTSAGDQIELSFHLPELLATPAFIHFLSYEPAIGPLDLQEICAGSYFINALKGFKYHDSPEPSPTESFARLDWVIAGGESGRKARPAHPDWFRSVREQCAAAGTPFFFKQWGEWGPGAEFTADISARRAYGGEIQTLLQEGKPELKLCIPTRDDDMLGPPLTLYRYGKKIAGAQLDGREHREVPR